MKRLTALILAFTLLFALTACKDSAAESSSPVSPTPSEALFPTPEPSPEPSAGPEAFVFTRDNFPRLDGSTSTAPLGRAVASALLGETEEEVSDLISFSRTTNSFRALMAGQADLLIVGEPTASVYDEMEAAGFEASIDTFATDGLIFVVNEDNPVDNLTTEQIRAIYSGEITNWSEVGGDDMPITPFQRNEDAGSQALMKKLVMGDTALMDAPAGYIVDSMMGLMEAVRSYDNSPGAIGYSVYYYANDMQMASGLKILSVDGVAPSAGTIRSQEYPHRNAYYVVMAADTPEDSPTARVYRWILSEEGQTLVDRQGYVSVLDVPSPSGEGAVTTLADRISEGPLPEFVPSEHYGAVVPYIGGEVYTVYPYEDMTNSAPTFQYGLCTGNGTILTDPVYNSIHQATWYDDATCLTRALPILILTQTAQRDNGDHYTAVGLAAADGSWYTGMIFEPGFLNYLASTSSGIFMKLDSGTIVMIGLDGQELFRWTEETCPFVSETYPFHLIADELSGILHTSGGQLYYRPSYLGLDGPEYQWIDPLTGGLLEEAPAEAPEDIPQYYYCDGYITADGPDPLEITFEDGVSTTVSGLPSSYGELCDISLHNYLFYDSDGTYTLTNALWEPLYTSGKNEIMWFIRDHGTSRRWACVYNCGSVSAPVYRILDESGQLLATTQCYPFSFRGLLAVVDDVSYRLIDLATGEDLIRLPRWGGMDLLAE